VTPPPVRIGAPTWERTVAGDVVTTRRATFRTQSDQIEFLREMVDAYRGLAQMRALARDIVFRVYNCEARNEVGYALAIADWVQRHVTYVREMPEEFQTPVATVAMGFGDCDDISVLICCLCEAVGIETELVGMEWDTPEGRGFGHIFARAVFGRYRVPLDATLEIPVAEMTDPIRVGLERGLKLRTLSLEQGGTMTFGLDPITATLVTTLGSNLLANVFGIRPTPSAAPGPSAAQIAAALAEQQRQADARRNAWLIGLGLAAAGVVAFVALRRK
jgi:hypothetical protein